MDTETPQDAPFIIRLDASGRVVAANERARTTLGPHLLGRDFADVVLLPDHLGTFAQAFSRTKERLNAGGQISAHNRWLDARGQPLDVLVTMRRADDGTFEFRAHPMPALPCEKVDAGQCVWRAPLYGEGHDVTVVVLAPQPADESAVAATMQSLPPGCPVVSVESDDAQALQAAIRKASTSWLAFAKAGDVFLPGKLDHLAALAAADVSLVHHRVEGWRLDRPVQGLLPERMLTGGWPLNGFAPPAGVMLRRQAVEEVVLPDCRPDAAVEALCHVAASRGRVVWLDDVWAKGATSKVPAPSAILVPVLNSALAVAGAPVAVTPGPDRSLLAFRNRHAGERAFIIGTGPSLTIPDLDLLHGRLTLSCNRIFLAFSATRWRPDYYAITDSVVAANLRDKVGELDCTKFACATVRQSLEGTGTHFVPLLPTPRRADGSLGTGFSGDALAGFFGGYTVLYFLLQLAFFMGVRDAVLLGVDFSFTHGKADAGTSPLGEPLVRQGSERNHFHPDYRPTGETWTLPRLDRQREAFLRARQVFEAAGGSLVNASRQTCLDVLPRVKLEDVLT